MLGRTWATAQTVRVTAGQDDDTVDDTVDDTETLTHTESGGGYLQKKEAVVRECEVDCGEPTDRSGSRSSTRQYRKFARLWRIGTMATNDWSGETGVLQAACIRASPLRQGALSRRGSQAMAT